MLHGDLKYVDVYSIHETETMLINHSIAPRKIFRTQYVSRALVGDLKYWRDIPSRASMISRLNKYFEKTSFTPDIDTLHRAASKVQQIWQNYYGSNLKVSSTMKSLYNLPKNTSAGLPFKSGVQKGEVRNQLAYLARKQWERIRKGKQLQILPCRSGARCQLRPIGENKPRLIWAYPGYISVIENQYLLPIKERPPPSFMGWSINWLDEGKSLNRLVFGDMNTWRSIAQIDFSSFDATVHNTLIHLAFGVVRSLFEMSKDEKIMFDQLRYYFVNTPLCFYNQVIVKERGIPSGSAFTQLIGSIVNMIACTYASEMSREFSLRHEFSCWLGDDSFLNFEVSLAKDEFDYHYLRYFSHLGLNVSVDKTKYTTRFIDDWRFLFHDERPTLSFLGKVIDVATLTFRNNVSKIDAQMVLPERSDLSPYETGVRLVGLVWAYGMHYDIYLQILKVYLSLKLKPLYHVSQLTQVSSKPERTARYLEHFLTSLKYQLNIELDSADLLSFPKFWTVSNRYFGPRYECLSFRSFKISD